MKSKTGKLVLGTVITAGIVLCGVFAFAAGGHGMGHGLHGDGCGHVYGEIIAIEGDTLTIAPSIPEFIRDKLDEHGVHLNIELPASATVTVTAETVFHVNGVEAAFDDFGIGDMVMAVGEGDGEFNITAKHVVDPASLKEHIDGLHAKFGDGHGKHLDGHPYFGEITAMDEAGVTIRPEIPAFMQEMFDQHHGRMNVGIELPQSVTLAWGDEAHFMVAGEQVEENPFKVGDKVGMMVQGSIKDGSGTVIGIGDYETARMHVEGMQEHAHGEHGCTGHTGHGEGHGDHGGNH